MKLNVVFVAIISTILLLSCENDETNGEIKLRMRNVSNQDFLSIYVSSGGEGNTFGALTPGKYSSYKTFDVAYRYGYIKVTTISGEFTLQPTDYVGERVLSSGEYTYEIGIEDGGVTLNFIKD